MSANIVVTSANATNLTRPIQVFDFDGVIWDPWKTKQLHPYTLEILNDLKAKGYRLFAASKRMENTIYEQNLYNTIKHFQLESYFEKVIVKSCSKVHHINDIIALTNCKPLEVVFYDDEVQNVRDVTAIGIISVLVNPEYGIMHHDIQY